MNAKYFSKFIITSSLLAGVIGCSNNGLQPTTGVEDDTKIVAATINSLEAQKVSTFGDELYAISYINANQSGDCYLYRYDGSNWTQLSHYGRMLAVSGSKKCYHVNYAGEIWWTQFGNDVGDRQVICPTYNGSVVKAVDVGAGKSISGSDMLWIVAQDNQWNRHIFKCFYTPGVNNPKWTRVTNIPATGFNMVAVDPANGNRVSVVGDSKLFSSQSYGQSWAEQIITNGSYTVVDVAYHSLKHVVLMGDGKLFVNKLNSNTEFYNARNNVRDGLSIKYDASISKYRYYYITINSATGKYQISAGTITQ